ncbi:hypothetical protein [Fibrella aquatica]|jgi:hypothetical protein|uniref:hypothetical protein n=1 Tax=Fibrella aquatica TaxID=3242487 RepID=UPI00352126B7
MNRIILTLFVSVLSLTCSGQTRSNVRFLHPDGQSALERIAMSYYEHPLAPDTTCIEAFCSATFIILRSSQIDSIQFSPGLPVNILRPLTDAILDNAEFWALDQTLPVRVVIPLYVVPSGLCAEQYRRNVYYQTASQLFNYGTPLTDRVHTSNYLHKANSTIEGLILAPMIVRGKVGDVFLIEQKK